jgi:hypothetical protein
MLVYGACKILLIVLDVPFHCTVYRVFVLTFTIICFCKIRMGADGARLSSMGPIAKVAFTVFPFVLLPITINFPW